MDFDPIYEEEYKYKAPPLELSKKFTILSCPCCETMISSNDVSIDQKIAKCGSCNALFSIGDEIKNLQKEDSKNQELKRPEGVEIFQFEDEYDIYVQQPFYVLEYVVLTLITLASFVTIGFFKEGTVPLFLPILFWTLPAFYFIRRIFYRGNYKVNVRITENDLMLKWQPKNVIKDKVIRKVDIHQLYVQANSSGLFDLKINYQTDNGYKIENLIPSIKSFSEAKYLEQEIENQLGLKNIVMPEETKEK